MDDTMYEAIGMLLRGVVWHEHSGGRTPEHLVGQIRRAIAILSPVIAAEIEQDGAARVYEERWSTRDGTQLTREEQLEGARNLEPNCEYGARRCGSCGRYGGGHEVDCRKVQREEREKLQAACDHREQSIVQTTGDPPGPPCCGRCGLELPAELIPPALSQ